METVWLHFIRQAIIRCLSAVARFWHKSKGQAQMNTLQDSSSDHVLSATLVSSSPFEPTAVADKSAVSQRPQLTSNTQAPGVSIATTTLIASSAFLTNDWFHVTNVNDVNERLGFEIGSGAGVSRPPSVNGAQNLAADNKRGRRTKSDNDVRSDQDRSWERT